MREVDHSVPPPLFIIKEEDQAAEDAYQAALAAVYRESKEDEQRRAEAAEEEEARYEAGMAQGMALSDASSQDPIVSVSLNLAPATAAASPPHRAPLNPALTRRPAKSMEPLCLLLLLLPAPLPSRQGLASPPPDQAQPAPRRPASSTDWALAHGEQPIQPSAHFSFGLLHFFSCSVNFLISRELADLQKTPS